MTYDGDGPNYAQGRLTKVEENTDSDAAAEVTHLYAYDHLGSVRVKQVEIEGLTGEKTLEYAYDLAGRITRIIYPDGAQARYAYDGAGRLSRVWNEQGKTLAAYTHTTAGNISTHVVGDAIATGTYAYNPREWVTGIDYPGRFTVSQQYDAEG
ncbi:MAG: RHS repeat protein [Gemmatimonadetes bacterium]|nr:RHS repeat protein [Gemmatimonadota bacterium]